MQLVKTKVHADWIAALAKLVHVYIYTYSLKLLLHGLGENVASRKTSESLDRLHIPGSTLDHDTCAIQVFVFCSLHSNGESVLW